MSFRPNTKEAHRANAAAAERILKYAEAMGLDGYTDSSSKSASHYVTVIFAGDSGSLKIRIANHELPDRYEPSNVHVEAGAWAEVVETIATRAGVPVPGRAGAILRKRRAEKAAIEARRAAENARYEANAPLVARIDARAREIDPAAFSVQCTGRSGRNRRNRARDRAKAELGIVFVS